MEEKYINELKICNTCNIQKELLYFRRNSNCCRLCNNKKQASNRLKHNKLFYQRHKEQLQEQNLINYYKRKYNNENLTVSEINFLSVMCE